MKIAFPSSPAEAKGLLKAAIRDDNPVIFLEHKRLYSVKGPAPEPDAIKGVPDALAAADALAADGLSAEVVDLCTLRPLDVVTVLESVAKTNRLLAVEEGPRTGGWAAGLLGVVAEEGLHDLDDAWIVATGETPIAYSPTLEDAFLPQTEAILDSVRSRLAVSRAT